MRNLKKRREYCDRVCAGRDPNWRKKMNRRAKGAKYSLPVIFVDTNQPFNMELILSCAK